MEDSSKNDIERRTSKRSFSLLANLDAYKVANEPAYKRFISTTTVEMKMKYIAWIVLALPLVMPAAPYYDPYNPNPNSFDIQAARETAAEHRHNAMNSSCNWFEESGRAAQAEEDAYRLDARRRENMRQENMRQSDRGGWHGYVTDDSPGLVILNEKEGRKALGNLFHGQNTQIPKAPVAVDPGKLNFYKVNERYPGEFGKFDVNAYRRACVAADYWPGFLIEIEKQVAEFREDWGIGLYMTSEPQPKDFYYSLDFIKAHAGWASRQDGLEWHNMQEGDRKRYIDAARNVLKEKKRKRNK